MTIDKFFINFEYFTNTGNCYPMQLGFGFLPSVCIPTSKAKTLIACQKGCNLFGKNGGCPPFSPDFNNLVPIYPFTYVFFLVLQTKHFPLKVLEGNFYVKWSFVEIVLGSLIVKLEKSISQKVNGLIVSSGRCTKCGTNHACKLPVDGLCANPSLRTFSLESCGVLVTELMKDSFNLPLGWFNSKSPRDVPKYMIKVSSILTKEKFAPYSIFVELKETLEGLKCVK